MRAVEEELRRLMPEPTIEFRRGRRGRLEMVEGFASNETNCWSRLTQWPTRMRRCIRRALSRGRLLCRSFTGSPSATNASAGYECISPGDRRVGPTPMVSLPMASRTTTTPNSSPEEMLPLLHPSTTTPSGRPVGIVRWSYQGRC